MALTKRRGQTVITFLVLLWVSGPGDHAPVVATVNGEAILLADVDAVVRVKPSAGPPLTASAVRSLRLAAVEDRIDDVLLKQFLANQNLTADAKEIDEQLRVFGESLARKKETLARFLKDAGMSEAELRAQFALLVGFEKFVDKVGTEAELQAFHRLHQEYFDRVTVKADIKLVRVATDASTAERAAARALAARGSGEPYAPGVKPGEAVILTKFDSPVDEPLAVAAFTLKPGERSPPIELAHGIATVTCLERTAPRPRPFAEIVEWVRDAYAARLRKEVLLRERKAATITISVP
jgi:parvulin-like peptidyl-prolyl isomerase